MALVLFEISVLPLAALQLGFQVLGFAACLVTDASLWVLELAGRLFSMPLTWYAVGLYVIAY